MLNAVNQEVSILFYRLDLYKSVGANLRQGDLVTEAIVFVTKRNIKMVCLRSNLCDDLKTSCYYGYFNIVKCQNYYSFHLYILGRGKITYTFSANANEFPFRFCLTHPPHLLVPRKM